MNRLNDVLGLLLVLFLLAAAPVSAGSIDELERYYTEVHGLSGNFVQETRDETGRLIERSEGTLAISRPNRFHWQYETPFEQDIIADGDNLWVYDQDLEQVTVRPLEEVLGSGPAMMLSGELADLESQFEIGTDGDWITLTPREGDWEMMGVRLLLSDGVPRTVVVLDGMGQENVLELKDLERNPGFAQGRFEFEPPAGVDVVGEVTGR